MKNRKKYPSEWTDVIRPEILKRDKYTCQKCGVIHRKTYVFFKDGYKMQIPKSEIDEWKNSETKAYTVYLQIAHLDQDVNNNNYINLLSLCVKCHLNYDRRHNNLKKKLNY